MFGIEPGVLGPAGFGMTACGAIPNDDCGLDDENGEPAGGALGCEGGIFPGSCFGDPTLEDLVSDGPGNGMSV